jgi:HAD superfamily hydrolase (TIGR01509 family)
VIRALVFDFDGLILDTETPLLATWTDLYASHGFRLPPDTLGRVVGSANRFDPVAELAALVSTPFDQDATRLSMQKRYVDRVALQPVLPGVRELHAQGRAANLKLGVASSSTRAWVVPNLERIGLDGWDCIRCRDDVVQAKPSPDLYLSVLEGLGVAPSEAIALEDSSNGIAAAKAAGLWCLAIPNPITRALDLSAADWQVESLAEATLEWITAKVASVA